jgi:hypothetical protein
MWHHCPQAVIRNYGLSIHASVDSSMNGLRRYTAEKVVMDVLSALLQPTNWSADASLLQDCILT